MAKKRKRTLPFILITVVLALIFTVSSYVGYVVLSYKRIGDNIILTIENQRAKTMDINQSYTVSTFNVGFGAYDHDFSFFMDSGTMKDGTKVSGKNATAKNKEAVLTNTEFSIEQSKALNADFMLFQEVDISATRSHKVNQFEMMNQAFANYSYSFAINYDSAFLFYPLNDPIGKSKSGISTYSKYNISKATRYSLPLSDSFAKFFDLDRCISLSRVPIEGGKELVLINAHLSAYDEGGTIRALQLEMLSELISTEYQSGNYVIVGGDFNHIITENEELFDSDQFRPDWVSTLKNEDLPDGFSLAAATNAPTCRSTDLPYVKGVNYTVVIDGFIVSDNVSVDYIENIDLDFVSSDHNPVLMQFSFK